MAIDPQIDHTRSLTLILGGARSGKSSYAEKLAAKYKRVLYVATAEARDIEMEARIVKHRAERPLHWQTLEASQQVGAAITAVDNTTYDVVLLDCLTMLASNVLLALPEVVDLQVAEDAMKSELDRLLEVVEHSQCHWIIVSNEVGLGIVPAYPLGRVYRDVLGRANQRLAAAADSVSFMVAGLPMKVK